MQPVWLHAGFINWPCCCVHTLKDISDMQCVFNPLKIQLNIITCSWLDI